MTPALVGRETELADLAEVIREDRSVALVGEAGVGKTALARAAAADARRGIREGGSYATLSWRPYLPLELAVGAVLAGDPSSVASVVEAVVGPDVLFIDDLQWADEQSLAALSLLIGRILVIGAVRSGDAGAAEAAAAFSASGGTLLSVEPLPAAASREIVRAIRPTIDAARLDEIVERAAGNPLLLEELSEGGEPSRDLAHALAASVDRLSAGARDAVELLAIVDRPVLAERIDPAVTEACHLGLVRDSRDGLRIRHDLVAGSVRDALSPSDARALHARAADLADDPADAARHLTAAGRDADGRRVALEALARIEAETTAGDPRTRAALLVAAADASAGTGALELDVRAARLLDEVGEWQTIVRILDGAGSTGTAELLVERDALVAHATYRTGAVEASRAHLARAQERMVDPTSPAAVRRTIEVATFLVNVEGAWPGALAALDDALGTPGLGPVAARDLTVLRAAISLLARPVPDQVALVEAGADEAFAAHRYRTATDRARVLQYLYLMTSSPAHALAFLLEQATRFEEVGLASVALEFRADAALAAVLAGNHVDALALADEVLERPAPLRARQRAGVHRARALIALGRLDECEATLRPLLATATPDFLGRGDALAREAELAYWSGRPAAAISSAESSLAIPAPIPVAHVEPRLVRAWAHLDLGRAPADAIDDVLAPSLAGAGDELRGLDHLHGGRFDEAAAAFDAAAERWAGFHATHEVLCRWAAGDALRRSGRLEEATAALTSALHAATAMSAEPIAARIRRSLRQSGVRSPGSARGATGTMGLTARERELVELVDRGLTNLEIARRLGIGRPTVARILSSAMLKLGAERRTQLAGRIGGQDGP